MALIDIPQYRSELAEIRKSLLAAGDALHIDHIREQLDELTEEMNQPEFWNDPDHSAKVNQKVSNLKGKLEHYEKLLSSADDIEVMLEMAEEEKDEDTVTEAVNELATLKEHTDALELETLMRGDYDDNDAVLSLHAGAGGTEAQDWTSMLYRMYTRYCEKMGFTVKLLDLLDGDEAGIKSVTFEVSGDHAYGYLRGEKGVHRLVRISPFDANARRHTSFASLDVAPMLEDDDSDIEINMKDVRVDTYHASGAGGQNVNKVESGVRARYLWKNPNTGETEEILIECTETRDQPKNKERALARLRTFIYDKEHQKYIDDIANRRKTMVSTGDRSAKIRTYNYPQSRITDHRIGYNMQNLPSFMDGNIQDCIDQLTVAENAERMKESEL